MPSESKYAPFQPYFTVFCINRLQITIQLELKEDRGQKAVETWSEIVADLWENYLPHMRDELHREGVPYSKTGDFLFMKQGNDDYAKEPTLTGREEEKERLSDPEPFEAIRLPDLYQATNTEEGKEGEEKKEESEVPKIPNQS